MFDEDLISIIIPVYNTEKYIGRCIESVLRQTYRNIEVVIVNDGSSDKSEEIIRFYSQNDHRIVFINKKREGVTAARNAALDVVKGQYIGFVDSDDYIQPNMYEKLLKSIKESKAEIATCGYNFAYDSYVVPATNKRKIPKDIFLSRDFLYYIYMRDEYKGVAGYIWTRLYDRNLIFDDKGKINYFKKEYDGADDIIFNAEVSLRSSHTVYISDYLYNYYQRDGSIVRDISNQLKKMYWIKAYEDLISIFNVNKVEKKVVNAVIRLYVYRCGVLAEFALKDVEKYAVQIERLYKGILQYVDIYIETNMTFPDRIEWINRIVNSCKLIGEE